MEDTFPLDPIQRAIDRQLSGQDRRLLPDFFGRTEKFGPAGLAYDGEKTIVLTDNGFCQKLIHQALDLKYFSD